MKIKITRDTLREIETKPNDTIHDTELKGFCVRVRPAGRHFYVVKRVGRRIAFIKIGDVALMPVSEAREKARVALARLALGEAPVQSTRCEEKTLRDFLEGSYAAYLSSKQKRPQETLKSMRAAFAGLLDVQIDKISAVMIDRWQAAFAKDRKPATVNRVMNDLRACIAYLISRGLLDKDPLTVVRRMKETGEGVVRFLTPDEEDALRAALDRREDARRRARASGNQWRIARGQDPRADLKLVAFFDHLKPAVLLAMNTGLRQGEQFALRWGDVDLTKGVLTVRAATAKAGKLRHIPLNAEARGVLAAWRGQSPDAELVFPGRDGKPLTEIKTAFARLLSDAGIERFRWHDMRHHFASRLVMAGVDLNTVRELLGHADLKMTLRYAHLAPEHKAAAVELISGAPVRKPGRSTRARVVMKHGEAAPAASLDQNRLKK